jgi:sugar phosphate isomerase/epimerase
LSFTFRHAICNEVFQGLDFAHACQIARESGYTGLEIAHFTLAESPGEIPPARREELKRMMAGEGLEFVGLHWLMVAPKGLHVTTPDDSLRTRSWDHIRGLIDLCGDLQSTPGLMVFGSPFQRNAVDGQTVEDATQRFAEGFAAVADQAAARQVTLLVEALPKAQSNIVNTVEAAVAIVEQVNHAAVRTMFDTHNAADETEPHAVILERYLPYIRHVHVNEMDGRYCGTGDYQFGPVLEVLKRNGFGGWVSLEVFDFKPDAATIACESRKYLEGVIQGIA